MSTNAMGTCIICLEEGESNRGKLDCCAHSFCFECIMKWSKVDSKCPLCKQRFTKVARLPSPGASCSLIRSVNIPRRDQVYEQSENLEESHSFAEPSHGTVCTLCQEGGNEDAFLICYACNSSAAHMHCVNLEACMLAGVWCCDDCHEEMELGWERGYGREYGVESDNEEDLLDVEKSDSSTQPQQGLVCAFCQEGGNEDEFLLCYACDSSAAHTHCTNLEASILMGDWFCDSCLEEMETDWERDFRYECGVESDNDEESAHGEDTDFDCEASDSFGNNRL